MAHAVNFTHEKSQCALGGIKSTMKILSMKCKTDFKTLLLLFSLWKIAKCFLLNAKHKILICTDED